MDDERMAPKLIKRHPLQRMESPSRGVSFLVHALGLASFFSSYKFLVENPTQINESYGWHFQYLTIIGLTLATITFSFGLLADITLSPTLFRIKNFFSIASTPMEVLISILYWGLRLVDEELLIPDWAELPPWDADLGFHAVPSIVLTLDLLLLSPPWAITTLPSLALSGIIAFAYWFWIELCYKYNLFYPYPIFGALDTVGRVALFGFSAVIMTAATSALAWFYKLVNSVEMGNAKRERPGNVSGRAKVP